MPDKVERAVRFAGMLLALVVGLASLVQAYAVLPYRVEQAEKSLHALQQETAASRVALARIEERLLSIHALLEERRK